MNIETIDLKSLRIFVTTAEYLNFTRAAEALGQPKSVVSKTISRLEAALDVVLFERSSRVVRLTEAGEILCTRARSLLEETALMLSDVRGMQSRVSGELRLAAPPALGRYLARELIPEFLRQWPEVSVSLRLSYEYEDLFKEGLDLAFRMGGHRDDNLIERPLGFANRVIVATPAYIAHHSLIGKPGDLAAHLGLQFFDESFSTWTVQNGDVSFSVPMRKQFQCTDMEALKNVLLSDIGIAQLPWLVVRDEIQSGRLVEVLPGWVNSGLKISAVYRFGPNKPAKLEKFLEMTEQKRHIFDLQRRKNVGS